MNGWTDTCDLDGAIRKLPGKRHTNDVIVDRLKMLIASQLLAHVHRQNSRKVQGQAIFVEIDVAAKRVRLDLPEGLRDLN